MTTLDRLILFIFLSGIILSCKTDKEENLNNTIFKLGFKTSTFSTGPLSNSGFVLKLKDSIPPLFITAHHVVAGTTVEGQYIRWNEIETKVRNACIWSMHDNTYEISLSENLPIPDAETMKLDLAAFYLPSEKTPLLKPSKVAAQVGDTVNLFSRILYNGDTTFLNPAMVIYTTDSILVYELLKFDKVSVMSGTSGSSVLNTRGEVISNSYAGFTIPNEEVKNELTSRFPLITQLKIQYGKSYGAGVPIRLIEKSLIQAIKAENKLDK